MKVCDKTCMFFFFPIINKYFLMAKRSLLSRCPSYNVMEASNLAIFFRTVTTMNNNGLLYLNVHFNYSCAVRSRNKQMFWLLLLSVVEAI